VYYASFNQMFVDNRKYASPVTSSGM